MNINDLLAFSLIEGFGEKSLNILKLYDFVEDVFELSENELGDIFHNKKLASGLKAKYEEKLNDVAKLKAWLQRNNAELIYRDSEKYPKRLLGFDKSPVFLYAIGNVGLLNSEATAAITGPRVISQTQYERTYNTAKSLCSEETVVVSGLALGVDTAAHQASVDFGKTIAVLPFLSPVYPPANKALCSRILESGGLIVAEYVASFNMKYQLLNRDKIIVGLADRVYSPCPFKQDSGTSYTVNYALSQGKPAYMSTQGIYAEIKK